MTQDEKEVAATVLADRIIDTVLKSKPELLIANVAGSSISEIQSYAEQFAQFRLALIQRLSQQPIVG